MNEGWHCGAVVARWWRREGGGGGDSLVEVCLEYTALRIGHLHSQLPEAQVHRLAHCAPGAVPTHMSRLHSSKCRQHERALRLHITQYYERFGATAAVTRCRRAGSATVCLCFQCSWEQRKANRCSTDARCPSVTASTRILGNTMREAVTGGNRRRTPGQGPS